LELGVAADGVESAAEGAFVEAELFALSADVVSRVRPFREFDAEPVAGLFKFDRIRTAFLGGDDGFGGFIDGRWFPRDARGCAGFVGLDRIRKAASGGGEIVFEWDEEMAGRGFGIAADGPDGAGGGDQADRAGSAVDCGALGFAEVSDREYGDTFFGGELGEGPEDFLDDGLKVCVAGADVGVDGIDDDEPAVWRGIDGGAELGEVVAEVGDRGDEEDAVWIGAGGVEAGADGVGEVVGGGEEYGGRGRKGEGGT